SATDVEQAYAVGKAAVQLALESSGGVMVTIERTADDPYTWRTGQAPLAEVANVERKLPPNYISQDGFGITGAALRYLRPLIAGEDYPEYAGGLPRYAKLKNQLTLKKLPPFDP
ncbi:MAG: diphosphate--fructose-6-phosphate 1-phosphotransferase, partial [Gammaproteobacteria bacterium]|nr:diphosphate--fructose-6-phosphate 1-phosphotransferase [Gammaproteobacteria bacterium]